MREEEKKYYVRVSSVLNFTATVKVFTSFIGVNYLLFIVLACGFIILPFNDTKIKILSRYEYYYYPRLFFQLCWWYSYWLTVKECDTFSFLSFSESHNFRREKFIRLFFSFSGPTIL